MQHHMFSLNTIKYTVSICENIKKCYIIGLLFIVTKAQIALLLETSDFPFSLPYKSTHPPFSSVPYLLICLF